MSLNMDNLFALKESSFVQAVVNLINTHEGLLGMWLNLTSKEDADELCAAVQLQLFESMTALFSKVFLKDYISDLS